LDKGRGGKSPWALRGKGGDQEDRLLTDRGRGDLHAVGKKVEASRLRAPHDVMSAGEVAQTRRGEVLFIKYHT